MTRRVLVAAHRGAHGPGVPANSLAAIERAADLGADMIEIDVRRCADGAMVLFHDADAAGTPLHALTHAQLADRLGHEPPTLDAALRAARGRLAVNVELKEDGYVDETVAAMRDAGAQVTLLVTSFLDAVVAHVGRLAPELDRGLLVEDVADGAVDRARAAGAGALSMSLELADSGLLDAAARAGLRCVVWEVDADADLRRMLANARVEAVITDRPAAALALRDGAETS